MRNCWKLILSSALLFGQYFNCFAQLEAADYRSEAYYMFPIKPGTQNTLAGTMGELRSTHFHTGIDIRTEGRTGLPVHAAAMGYISRVAVSTSGYGNALYVTHPNGHTTVYAHLEKFEGPIAEYVLKEQYRLKTFELDQSLYQGKFIVQKGDTIAWSGNSGSSGGPHLHFDIRDEKQQPLNPLSYGFDEVLDRTPPIAEKIIARTLNEKSRVGGVFGQEEYRLRRIGNNYKLDRPIQAIGEIGLMLDAHDKLDYSRFRCGINTMIMEVNGTSTYEYRIKKFSFGEQKNIYKHMSYEDLYKSGERWHKLYVDDGNELRFYSSNKNNGKLYVKEGDQLTVKITMIDTYGNRSHVDLSIEGKLSKPLSNQWVSGINTDIQENIMIISSPKSFDDNLSLNGVPLLPSYITASSKVYLYDLRKDLPKLMDVGGEFIPLSFKETIAPNKSYTYYSDEVDVYFQREALFDTLYFESNYISDSIAKNEVWTVGRTTVPLRKSIKVELKTDKDYDRNFSAAYFLDGKTPYYEGGNWEKNQISFWTRKFGDFTILTDSIAPYIRQVRVNSNDLMFKISDNLSGIKDFNCYVNDEWVLMHYDYKRALIWSEKLNKNKPFNGIVKLIVRDNMNNETILETKIY
ncbi:M23 family metallopeptidase [Fulvivirga lutea]|uniref:M23 family metallopeptidase n=1 Tax=Fulvivirga lutea TaxID=2810512 RepID=A0A974ZZX1_9BACT|nr:M23 family metallopeptidase [Fulvivirga lutea]QSE96759.1 M23 family metallopeptidase [Fulvivirga lutea]